MWAVDNRNWKHTRHKYRCAGSVFSFLLIVPHFLYVVVNIVAQPTGRMLVRRPDGQAARHTA